MLPVIAMAVGKMPQPAAASYARFSSKAQDERTIADQQRQCRERAERDRFVSGTLLEFADEAISGAKHSRQGLTQLMAAAREGQFKVLYIVNLSRLARDCVLTLQTLRELVYVHKIRVVSIDEGIDSVQSDSWELVSAILGVQHEQFLKKLSTDVFRGLQSIVLDGYCAGDHCFGFGSELVPGTESGKGRNRKARTRYVKLPDEVEWVCRIFHRFVNERRPISWIVRELNRNNAPKDHRSTTPYWTRQLVIGVLSNRKYIGLWPWGEKKNVRSPMNGKTKQEDRSPEESAKWLRHFPDLQIVDDEIFEKAQKLLQENADAHGHARQSNGQLHGSSAKSKIAHPGHLLSLLLECGHCGHVLYVGGCNGRYLFCPNYARGSCACRTQLHRELAEKLILQVIGKRILSNPVWVELLLKYAHEAYDKLLRETPSRRRSLEAAKDDVENRIRMLISNCESGKIPELESRFEALRTERVRVEKELQQLALDNEQPKGPPTRAWIEKKLMDLQSILSNGTPAAAHALRALLGGKIVVTEIQRPNKSRHFWRGRLELHLRAVAGAVDTRIEAGTAEERTDIIEIDFRKPEKYELIADDVKRLWDEGKTDAEIAHELKCSRSSVTKAHDFWYQQHGIKRPDGRSCRKRLKGRRKADELQPKIMELFHQDCPIGEIATKLDCCWEHVREAVESWYQQRGLPVPDGRRRRREIRLKKRAS